MDSMLTEVAVVALDAGEVASLAVEAVKSPDLLQEDILPQETRLLLPVTLVPPRMFLSMPEKRHSEVTMLAMLPETQPSTCCFNPFLEYLVKTTQSMLKSLKLPLHVMVKLMEVRKLVFIEM